MAFLDLMAYAKGAELANKANWQDVLNDVNVRNTEQQMLRAQTTYDLSLPSVQLRAEADVLNQMGAASHSAFEAQTVSALSKLPPEQQGTFLADQIGNRLRTVDPSSPAGAAELKQTEAFAVMKAQQLQAAGDSAGAQAILRTIPGAGAAQADRTANILKWSNPAALTPQDITDAGGELLPNGRVKYGMLGELDPLQFIQIQRSLAMDPSQNLGASGEKLQQMTRAREGAADLTTKLAAQGIASWTDPNTFKVHPIGRNGVPDMAVNLNPQAAAATATGAAPAATATGAAPAATATGAAPAAAQPPGAAPSAANPAAVPTFAIPEIMDPYTQLAQGGAAQPETPGMFRDAQGRIQLLQPGYDLAAWLRSLGPAAGQLLTAASPVAGGVQGQVQPQPQWPVLPAAPLAPAVVPVPSWGSGAAARANAPAVNPYDPNAIYNGLPPQTQTPWLTGGNR